MRAVAFATMGGVRPKRSTRAIIASASAIAWLGYMVIGLQLINYIAPTVRGSGPEGAAAFLGLISGIVVCGVVMWAASD
jgi:hypothetical protein